MKHKVNLKEVFFIVMMICFAICILVYAVHIIYKERKYLASGESIDLNEYIRNIQSYNNELPMDQTCTLSVNRCYGRFYSYTSPAGYRHQSSTSYYYVIGLEDGSLMVLYAGESDNAELDRLTDYTFSGQDGYAVTFTGFISELNEGLIDYYDSHVNYYKEQGVIDKDAEVRYVSMNNIGSREANYLLIFCLFAMFVMCILVCVVIHKHFVEKREYEEEIHTPFTIKDIVKWIVMYIIMFLVMYVVLYMHSYGDVRTESKNLRVKICLVVSLILPTISVIDDKDDRYGVPGLGLVHIKSPALKNLEAFTKDIAENGYSEAMVDTADNVIKEYKQGQPVDMIFFKDYILNTADYNIMLGRYEVALQYLDIINTKQLMDRNVYSVDKGIGAFVYWAEKFEVYRGLGDIEAAEKLFAEAEHYWNNKYMLNDDKRFWKDVSLCQYYLLKNNLEEASKCAERLYMYNTVETENVTAYLLNAEIYRMKGDKESEAIMMDFAKEKAEKGIAPVKQWYESAKERYYE